MENLENKLVASIQKQGTNLRKMKQDLFELKREIAMMRKHNYTMARDVDDLQLHELREEVVNLAEQQHLIQEAVLKDHVNSIMQYLCFLIKKI